MSVIIKFEAYLLTEMRVSHNTLSAYRSDLKQLLTFLKEEESSLHTATIKDLKAFLVHLHSNGVGARSMARKIAAIKKLFFYLSEFHGYQNHAQDLITPKMKKSLPIFLTEEEIGLLLHTADGDESFSGVRNKTMLYLLYVSGMRISEMVNMTINDVHSDTGNILIRGKGDKERIIPLPDFMLTMLNTYIATVRTAFIGGDVTIILFPSRYSGKFKPLSRQAFFIILNTLWAKTGIKKVISPHKLRHSLATHMLKNGTDLRSLQLLLGHENVTTVEIYTHVETTRLREVYDDTHPRSK